MKRILYVSVGVTLITFGVFGVASKIVGKKAIVKAAGIQAPIFEVDPYWPKPLPNHWVTGSTIGVSVDAQDNVWTIQRGQTVENNFKAADLHLGACCKVAPPVLEYDQAGNLVKSWGGPGEGYHWPDSNHGITVDHKGNVWIGGNGRKDTEILKFTNTGNFLMQLGTYGVHNGSNDVENFWMPAKIFEDPTANEVYIADGYGNRRVIVFDEDTGKYKRHWGAYGNKPDDTVVTRQAGQSAGDEESAGGYNPDGPPSKNFNTVHCVIIANDGLVYVCDRVNDRIQVFHKDGTYVKEAFIDPQTLRSGSVWDMTFSRDPQQTYIYQANGVNEKINVILRSSLQVVTSFGDGGRQPGEFFGCHNVATDSKGNLYVTETYTGARIQRFLYKGIGTVERDQGVPWPKNRN
jgi:DNA-binding beta-propeller fold protein YncE